MLGDVGGLQDILTLSVTGLIGVINEPLLVADLMNKLFREAPEPARKKKSPD